MMYQWKCETILKVGEYLMKIWQEYVMLFDSCYITPDDYEYNIYLKI